MVTQKLVAAGLAVALLPALAVEAVCDPGVAVISLKGQPPRRIRLEHPADTPASPATTALTAALLAVTASRR